MSSDSAPVTLNFGERDTGSASTDDALDRSLHNRRLRTTKLSARREPWSLGESVATEHIATLIASPSPMAPRSLPGRAFGEVPRSPLTRLTRRRISGSPRWRGEPAFDGYLDRAPTAVQAEPQRRVVVVDLGLQDRAQLRLLPGPASRDSWSSGVAVQLARRLSASCDGQFGSVCTRRW
jgi:hypothetical protein